MPQEFYSEEEAKQILGMASRQSDAEISRQDLMQMAKELGIAESDLLKAESSYKETQKIAKQKKEFRRIVIQSYVQTAVAWVLVIPLLIFIWAFLTHGPFWPIFPIIGFVIGMPIALIELRNTLGPNFESKFSTWKLKQDAKSVAKEAFRQVLKKFSK